MTYTLCVHSLEGESGKKKKWPIFQLVYILLNLAIPTQRQWEVLSPRVTGQRNILLLLLFSSSYYYLCFSSLFFFLHFSLSFFLKIYTLERKPSRFNERFVCAFFFSGRIYVYSLKYIILYYIIHLRVEHIRGNKKFESMPLLDRTFLVVQDS